MVNTLNVDVGAVVLGFLKPVQTISKLPVWEALVYASLIVTLKYPSVVVEVVYVIDVPTLQPRKPVDAYVTSVGISTMTLPFYGIVLYGVTVIV